MARSDLDRVVALHIASFPDYFMTSLGGDFLREFYQEAMDEIALVALVDGRVVGTQLTFTRPSKTFQKMVLRSWLKFARLAAPAAARGPWQALRVALGVLKPLQTRRGSREAIAMYTAVDPSCRGQGVATLLLKRMIAEAEVAGVLRIHGENDDHPKLNRLYESVGFAKAGHAGLPFGGRRVKMAAPVKIACEKMAADLDFMKAVAEAKRPGSFIGGAPANAHG